MLSNQSLVSPYACAYADTPPVRLMNFVIFVIAAVIGPLAMVSASPAHAQNGSAAAVNPTDPFAAYITESARRFSVPALWIRAVMRAESAGDVSAVSSSGAMGLMQIMPQTWADLRVRHRLGTDPFDPRDNILAGTAYLREMHGRFGSPGFLAAYNAGPGRYEEHLATGWELPAETQAFVAILAPLVGSEHADGAVVPVTDPQAWTLAPIFIARAESIPSDDRLSSNAQPERNSTRRSIVDILAITPQSGSLFVQRADSRAP